MTAAQLLSKTQARLAAQENWCREGKCSDKSWRIFRWNILALTAEPVSEGSAPVLPSVVPDACGLPLLGHQLSQTLLWCLPLCRNPSDTANSWLFWFKLYWLNSLLPWCGTLCTGWCFSYNLGRVSEMVISKVCINHEYHIQSFLCGWFCLSRFRASLSHVVVWV